MTSFLKRNAVNTTIGLALLMLVVAAGGLASEKGIGEIAGLLAFMLLFWPVVFVPMSLFTLLQPLYRGAAAFGSSLGRQAVNSPRKEAGAAVRDALGSIDSGRPGSTEAKQMAPRAPSGGPPATAPASAQPPVAIAMPSGAGANPIGKAFKRFRNGDADNLAFFYQSTVKLPEILAAAKE